MMPCSRRTLEVLVGVEFTDDPPSMSTLGVETPPASLIICVGIGYGIGLPRSMSPISDMIVVLNQVVVRKGLLKC